MDRVVDWWAYRIEPAMTTDGAVAPDSELPWAASPSPSQTSIGFDVAQNSQTSVFNPYGTGNVLASEKHVPVQDICCLVLYCARHDRILAFRLEHKGLCQLHFPLRPTDSWAEIARDSLRQLLPILKLGNAKLSDLHLIEILRRQLPKQYPHYLTRVTFALVLEADPDSACLQILYPEPYRWVSSEQVKLDESLWAIELIELLDVLREQSRCTSQAEPPPATIQIDEFGMSDAALSITSSNAQWQKERELLLSARFTVEDIDKLYNEFLLTCLPSRFMTYAAFRMYLRKIGWTDRKDEGILKFCAPIFHAYLGSAKSENRCAVPYLTFHELIVGLAAMEERADHRGNCATLRLHYIFHFYDEDHDGKLNERELVKLANETREPENSNEVVRRASLGSLMHRESVPEPTRQPSTLDKLVQWAGATSGPNLAINLSQFLECVTRGGEVFLKLTEGLFRAPIITIEAIKDKFDYQLVLDPMNPLRGIVAANRYDQPCDLCRQSHFALCVQSLRISEKGTIKEEGIQVLDAGIEQLNIIAPRLTDRQFATVNAEMHRISLAVQAAAGQDGTVRPPETRTTTNVLEIVRMAREAIRLEPILVRCQSPCYVVGELWSNVAAMYQTILTVNQAAPFLTTGTFIFLGNYIDPNATAGLETLIYLLCCKLLMPQRIVLLRGPNEFKANCEGGKLQQECEVQLWTEVLELFELLPLAATIDERIYVTKSGFPPGSKPLNKYDLFEPTNKKPIIALDDPQVKRIIGESGCGSDRQRSHSSSNSLVPTQTVSKSSSNSLGSSPTSAKSSTTKRSRSKTNKKSSSTVNSSTKRQTKRHAKSSSAKCSSSVHKKSSKSSATVKTNGSQDKLTSASTLSKRDVLRFLRTNDFSYVIRADWQQNQPFQVSCRGRMITLGAIGQPSSSNKPIGGKLTSNPAAIVLGCQNKIRLLRLDN